MLVHWGIWTEPSRYWKAAETSWFGPSTRADCPKLIQMECISKNFSQVNLLEVVDLTLASRLCYFNSLQRCFPESLSALYDGWNKNPLLLHCPPTKAATFLHSYHKEDNSEQYNKQSIVVQILRGFPSLPLQHSSFYVIMCSKNRAEKYQLKILFNLITTFFRLLGGQLI